MNQHDSTPAYADMSLERLEELLADQALWGLDEPEQSELARLQAAHPDYDDQSLDLITGQCQAAWAEPADTPPGLELRLAAAGWQFLRANPVAEVEPASRSESATRRADDRQTDPQSDRGWGIVLMPWTGWAAAAALLLTLVTSWSLPSSAGNPGTMSFAALQQHPASQFVDWETPQADRPVRGQVLWNAELKQGYMVFEGLPANDPAEKQYQLWIVDANRDGPPVDGGVFNIPAASEPCCVPIQAKLPVFKAKLFAVTEESPGGVVVSKQQQFLVTAAIAK